jgi:hypothetical protein
MGYDIARAKIRVMVKCILSKYGYPPDKQGRRVILVWGLFPDWSATGFHGLTPKAIMT